MNIVRKLPTDLLYIIVQYLPNRNREKYRIQFLYDKYVYYYNLTYQPFILSLFIRNQNIRFKIQEEIIKHTKDYLKKFSKRGKKVKDLPFFFTCDDTRKRYHSENEIMTYTLFKNEPHLFKYYISQK